MFISALVLESFRLGLRNDLVVVYEANAATRMPTLRRSGPYRFFFYSNEQGEPPHIHVQRDHLLAKCWLRPVALASSTHFPSHELRTIMEIVRKKQDILLEAWNEHVGG